MPGIILILIAAVLFPGIILRTKSITAGRRGPGLLQPLRDIGVLLRKGSVFSTTSGLIFRIAPSLTLASIVAAISVVPFGNQNALISFGGDFVFFAYMLALGKFFTIIGALDTGSSFEGMGANREALFSMLVEPAFFILIGTFAMFTGLTSFSEMFSQFHVTGNHYVLIFSVISFYLLVQIAMIENSRLPVDDPKTHLELTMIHEVMILDNSGYDLGLILYAVNLKFAMYGAIIANFFMTPGFQWAIDLPIYVAVQLIFAVLVGIIESFSARFRMSHNPQFILMFTSISLLIFLGVLLMTGKIL